MSLDNRFAQQNANVSQADLIQSPEIDVHARRRAAMAALIASDRERGLSSGIAWAVALYLIEKADPRTGRLVISNRALAAALCRSEQGTHDAVKNLRERGWLKSKFKMGRHGVGDVEIPSMVEAAAVRTREAANV